MSNEMLFGCIPNADTPEDVAAVEALAAPWDAADQPIICTWESYKPFLEAEAERMNFLRSCNTYVYWWDICKSLGLDPVKLLIPSQLAIGSCAGVSLFDRCYQITRLKQRKEGSEQMVEPVNALPTWLNSKGWSRWGGQSIAGVLREGCSTGVFPASMVGDYSVNWNDKAAFNAHLEDAKQRQIGSCMVSDGEDPVEAIELILRAGKVVEIGQGVGIADGTTRDENGVEVVTCSGGWSHATCFSELVKINGTEYFRWENSHGLIYSSYMNAPAFGGLMTKKTLERFCSSSFCDIAAVTYVESPYDTTLKTSLIPGA